MGSRGRAEVGHETRAIQGDPMTRIRLALIALSAALIFVCAAGTGTAARLSVSEQNIVIAWSPTFRTAGSVSCESITLGGSFHSRTLAKTQGLLVGHVREAAVTGACSGGAVTVLVATLPWHIRYEAFAGTLPRITSISFRIVDMSIQVMESTGARATCLYRTTAARPAGRITNLNETGRSVSIRADESLSIPSITGGLCAFAPLTISGSGGTGGIGITYSLI